MGVNDDWIYMEFPNSMNDMNNFECFIYRDLEQLLATRLQSPLATARFITQTNLTSAVPQPSIQSSFWIFWQHHPNKIIAIHHYSPNWKSSTLFDLSKHHWGDRPSVFWPAQYPVSHRGHHGTSGGASPRPIGGRPSGNCCTSQAPWGKVGKNAHS